MRIALLIVSLGLGSSALAEPAGQPPVAAPPSAALIGYSLPSSRVKVTLGLTLTRCVGAFEAKPEVAFVPEVGPNPHPQHRFQLDGRNLSSFWKNKKLQMETYPTGSLKSLNGAMADQTGSIISTVIKTAGSLLALDDEDPISIADNCNDETKAALARAETLAGRIKLLRSQLASTPPAQVEGLTKAIDAMAAEVARLQTNELRLDLAKELVLEPHVTGGTLVWKRADFAKWLTKAPANAANPTVSDIALGVCITPDNGGKPPACDKAFADKADVDAARTPTVPPVVCPGDAPCATTIVLREPRRARIAAVNLSPGAALKGAPTGEVMKRGNLVISQWGELSYLPLRVGFGKSISFAMGFDEHGHKVSQTWDSTARGATMLGAASAVTDATIGAYKAINGEVVAEQKAEIDRLNTLKAFNQARFCQAVIEAGGFTCP